MGGRSLAHLMFSNPLALAFRGQYGTDMRFWWYAWEVPIMLLLGLISGLAMAGWTALNIKLQVGRAAFLKGPLWKVADVMLCCLVTNTIRLIATYASPCVSVPPAGDVNALQEQVSLTGHCWHTATSEHVGVQLQWVFIGGDAP